MMRKEGNPMPDVVLEVVTHVDRPDSTSHQEMPHGYHPSPGPVRPLINNHFLFPDQGRGTQCRANIQINSGISLSGVDMDQEGLQTSLLQSLCHTVYFSLLLSIARWLNYGKLRLFQHTPPLDYDLNAKWVLHSGAPRHSIENCKSFKCKVYNLINSRVIMFTSQCLNIVYTLMPPHECASAMP